MVIFSYGISNYFRFYSPIDWRLITFTVMTTYPQHGPKQQSMFLEHESYDCFILVSFLVVLKRIKGSSVSKKFSQIFMGFAHIFSV